MKVYMRNGYSDKQLKEVRLYGLKGKQTYQKSLGARMGSGKSNKIKGVKYSLKRYQLLVN
jgi:hypothetical protein